MTKQETYKIGAHPFPSSKFNKKPNFRHRVSGSFNRSSPRKNYANQNHQNKQKSTEKRSLNKKNKPIRKQFNRNSQKTQINSKDYKNHIGKDNRSFKAQISQKNRKNQTKNNNVKRQDLNFKKQEIKSVDPAVQVVEAKKQKQKRIKHNRVIIRNLVFDISESHLRRLLSPFGEIVDIHIPQNPDKKGSRGFAFVEFANRNFALKAIKDLNGTSFKGRQIVLDESVSKERFLQSRINDQQKERHIGSNNSQLSQNLKLQQIKISKIQEEQVQNNGEEHESQSQLEFNKEKNEVSQESKKQNNQSREKTEEQILQDISSEVFIRNLPISVHEKALHQFFRRYGQLKFAKIVINKQTGLSKGSAFLKFQNSATAKELVEYSRNYELNLLGKNPNFKINPAINLELEGTVLKLFPVQTRNNIKEKVQGRQQKDKAREQKKKEEEKKKRPIKKVKSIQKLVAYDPNDKRNLKLALLGINKVTDDMNEPEQERFINHEKEKLQKLKNPNNSVSGKRIIFKFLKKDITEQDIKNLCHQYLNENQHKLNNLTYCKLMLESLQTKKSAGFAFVEFKNDEISLRFLDWIAQDPKKLMKEPYVCQFAIQDSRKMAKLEKKNKNHLNKNNSLSKPKSQKNQYKTQKISNP